MMEIVAGACTSRSPITIPTFPNWEDRDRIVWSGGHKAPRCISGWAWLDITRWKTWSRCASCIRRSRGIRIG